MSVKGDLAKILLTAPACTEIGEKVALSRRIDKHWRLVGTFISIFICLIGTTILLVVLISHSLSQDGEA